MLTVLAPSTVVFFNQVVTINLPKDGATLLCLHMFASELSPDANFKQPLL